MSVERESKKKRVAGTEELNQYIGTLRQSIDTYLLVSSSPVKRSALHSIVAGIAGSIPHEKRILITDANKHTFATPYEQPVGEQQAFACARARFDSVLKRGLPPSTLVVVVENFIEQRCADETSVIQWYDRCLVLIGNDLCCVSSIGCYEALVPEQFAPNLDDPTLNTLTIGKRIAAARPDVDHANWFRAAGNSFDRRRQVAEALGSALCRYARSLEVFRSIRVFKDFPKDGVDFLDIFSTMASRGSGVRMLVDLLEHQVRTQLTGVPHCRLGAGPPGNDHGIFVVGLESRGMALGMVLADRLGCHFLPMRKVGKLPGNVRRQTFTKEYGDDAFELQMDYGPNDGLGTNAIIVDDVLATGGSMIAACRLVDSLPFNVRVSLIVTLLDVPALRDTWRKAIDDYRKEVDRENNDIADYTKNMYRVSVCMDSGDGSCVQQDSATESAKWVEENMREEQAVLVAGANFP